MEELKDMTGVDVNKEFAVDIDVAWEQARASRAGASIPAASE